MKRDLGPEEVRLWAKVLADVKPRKGRVKPRPPAEAPEVEAKPAAAPARGPARPGHAPVAHHPPRRRQHHGLHEIEPNRERRIALSREGLGGRIDLHGMDQDRARAALESFLVNAHADGARAVLVITGKGTLGEGVLRRRLPDWLASGVLRSLVAGVSEARRKHGGRGAFYVALKR